MTLALWTIVAILVGLLAVLQFMGVRALESWGVSPSRTVLTLRIVNFSIVTLVLIFALWQWGSR